MLTPPRRRVIRASSDVTPTLPCLGPQLGSFPFPAYLPVPDPTSSAPFGSRASPRCGCS